MVSPVLPLITIGLAGLKALPVISKYVGVISCSSPSTYNITVGLLSETTIVAGWLAASVL